MSDAYSRTEIDLKMETFELRTQAMFQQILGKFDAVDSQFKLIDPQFKLIVKDIHWLKWLVGGILFLLLGIVSAGGHRWAIHI